MTTTKPKRHLLIYRQDDKVNIQVYVFIFEEEQKTIAVFRFNPTAGKWINRQQWQTWMSCSLIEIGARRPITCHYPDGDIQVTQ